MGDPTLGILGGMGPAASLYFVDRLIGEEQRAATDQGHARFLLLSASDLPDRNAAYYDPALSGEFKRQFQEDLMTIQRVGCWGVVVSCFTAHIWLETMRPQLRIPVLSFVDEFRRQIAGTRASCCLLLGTNATIDSGLFEVPGRTIRPGESDQDHVLAAIRQIKAGNHDVIDELSQVIRRYRAGSVALVCTELAVLESRILETLSDVAVLSPASSVAQGIAAGRFRSSAQC